MLLTGASAKALAAIALVSMLGQDECKKRLPLRIESDGAYWIVKGKTSPQPPSRTFLRGFHVYIDKATAEMRDVETGDMKPFRISPAALRIMLASGWRPPKRGRLGLAIGRPYPAAMPSDVITVLYHGVLGTSEAAVAYARVLMRESPRLASLAGKELHAEARDDVWHVTVKTSDGASPQEVISISRVNGKVMSGAA